MTNSEFLSNLLYEAFMGSDMPTKTIQEACERFNVSYPPKLFKGSQATHQVPVFETSEVN